VIPVVSLDREIYDRFFEKLGRSDAIDAATLEKLRLSLSDKRLPKPEPLIELLTVRVGGGDK
jgi:hypothetical protein